MSDLFGIERALMPVERKSLRKPTQPKGYAAVPGTGPTNETCGSCAHLERKRMAKTYLKCALMRSHWTGGAGTDVRARSPACRNWMKGGEA